VLTARLTTGLAGSYVLIGTAIAIVAYLFQEVIPTRAQSNADRPEGPFARFFDQESSALPVILGLALLASGGCGLLVVSNYAGIDWVGFIVLAGAGAYVLKRTFTASK
jgi:hypothetical protein